MTTEAKRIIRPAGPPRVLLLGLALSTGLCVMAFRATASAQFDEPRVAPSFSYFSGFREFHDGEYEDALKHFRNEGRGAIKTVDSLWIDSICYHTMSGECYYHMGRLQPALEHYTHALELATAYSDWMLQVRFQPIRPANPGQLEATPWGRTTRRARVGRFPNKVLIAQGRLNNNAQIQQGGVVQNPVLFNVNAQEIARCTTLAIRRRRDLLGPASEHDPLTGQVLAALARRPTQRGHWSEAWVSAQLGLAYSAAGKTQQARTELEQAIVAQGEYDHPLTPVVLLELGRLALEAGDFVNAATLFGESTLSAAQFDELGVMDEAFRWGLATHIVSNAGGVYAPLEAAANWARVKRYQQLQASLLILAAENACALRQPVEAMAMLGDARDAIGRRAMGGGALGAEANRVQALALVQQNKASQADAFLKKAIDFQRGGGSHWLFQIAFANSVYTAGQITPRVAVDLYADVLREPTPADWSLQPLEALSVLAQPHADVYENWFEAAIARKERERALEIADLARRHRFLSTLDMGGRLLNLRTVLEGPDEWLDQVALLQRQDLLVRYPDYKKLSGDAAELRERLRELPLAADNDDQRRQQATLMDQLATVSAAQEAMLREIALRRTPCKLVYPPVRTTESVRQALPKGHALLAFFATRSQTYGFFIADQQYDLWSTPNESVVRRDLVGLLREMGNSDQNREVELADLASPKWKEPAGELLAALLAKSNVNLPGGFEELVIVPDGLLWYVPFEALPGGGGQDSEPLISRLRVRYSPTVGLGLGDVRPRKPPGVAAVVLGQLFPRDDPAVARAAFEQFTAAMPGAVELSGPALERGDVTSSLIDTLVVLSDLPRSGSAPYQWSPLAGERSAAGSTLAGWMALPWGGPQTVILPGFHTPAENALKGAVSGDDVFLSLCGLMSGGARTIVLSRWRPAGQTTFDLVREFSQELPHTTAAEAWQRGVLLARETPLDPALEPRVRAAANFEPTTAKHPFFWSAYLLIDTGAPPPLPDAAIGPAAALGP